MNQPEIRSLVQICQDKFVKQDASKKVLKTTTPREPKWTKAYTRTYKKAWRIKNKDLINATARLWRATIKECDQIERRQRKTDRRLYDQRQRPDRRSWSPETRLSSDNTVNEQELN